MGTTKHHKRIRVTQVAQLAGVSPSTVSKVINGRRDVSDRTRQKVENALFSTGYKKKLVTTKVSPTINLLVPHLQEAAANKLVAEILQQANDYDVNIGITHINEQTSTSSMSKVLSTNPYGVIILLYRLLVKEQVLLENRKIPHVIIGQFGEVDSAAMSVGTDNYSAGLAIGEHLIKLGHTRIGVITGPKESQSTNARLSGFETAMRSKGNRLNRSLLVQGDFQLEAGYRSACKLLDLKQPPTAIFALNDSMAIGVYRAAHERGLSIPRDLSVIGYDDTYPSAYLAPPLTTFHQPFDEIAKASLKQIIAEREGTEMNRHIVLPGRLMVRESTAKPKSS